MIQRCLRPKKNVQRHLVKPSRYQTSSDEAPSKKIANNEGEQRNITASLDADLRELRGILRENSSFSYNNNNTNLQTLLLEKQQDFVQRANFLVFKSQFEYAAKAVRWHS